MLADGSSLPHHAAAVSSAREAPSPVAIHPLIAQAVDDLVAAVDRTHCVVVVHGCALTQRERVHSFLRVQ